MTTITLTGNATGDAESRDTNGTPLATFSLAVTPRKKQPDGSWGDGPTAYYRVAAFQQLAEHVAQSVRRGDRVTVVGRLEPREFEHNGEKRMSLDVAADEVALSLRFATATATKAQRQQSVQQSQGGPRQQADPWSQPQQQGQQQHAWGGQQNDPAPF